MDQPSSADSSPVPIAKRQTVSKYPRLDTGFPVASLDPEPIHQRDREVDAIWRESVQFFKMYLNDVTITFDKIHLLFNRATAPSPLNVIRAAILKRLEFDGIKTGNIAMLPNQQNLMMELTMRGFPNAATTFQKEVFSLIAVIRPPDFAKPLPQKS